MLCSSGTLYIPVLFQNLYKNFNIYIIVWICYKADYWEVYIYSNSYVANKYDQSRV